MKELLSNLWKAPASTIAGGLVALGIWISSGAFDLPVYITLPASGLAIFLGAVYPGTRPDPK